MRYDRLMECVACHTQLIDDAAYCPRCGLRQPGVPECDVYDYSAFISYRHREPDSNVASRIHRAIETYRLPKAVAQAYGAPKLGRAFLDQEELPATGSLPTAIRDALRHARSLVVVCSTATPESRWVAQEIELFASYHGRDRIFAVLAEGASAHSMPPALRTCLVPDANGKLVPTPTEPLAADMRPDAKNRFDREKLRVIAAIASCSYDDLQQRDQKRKRQNQLAIIVAAIVIAVTIGAFAVHATQQREAALIEESQRLAVESQQLLAQGDRYGAIETALSALPASSSDTSRPLIPEAQEALEQALAATADPASPWRSGYTLDLEHGLGLIDDISMINKPDAEPDGTASIAVSESGGFFAISDDAGTLCTYDLHTGKRLATCEMPTAETPTDGMYARKLKATDDKLIVSNPSASVIACFDPFTGNCTWSDNTVSIATMEATADGRFLDIASFDRDGTFFAGIIDLETGELLGGTSTLDADFPALGHGAYSAITSDATRYAVAVGNTLALADLDAGALTQTPLAYPELSALTCIGDTIIACTVEAYDGEELELHYAVEAFDLELKRLWKHENTLASEMSTTDEYVTLALGWPTVRGITQSGSVDAVVISAGRNVYALDLNSGTATYEHGFASTVLATRALAGEGGTQRLIIACMDGTIVMENPESPTRNYDGDQFRLQLGSPIRWSGIALDDGGCTWLSATANAPNHLVAYRTDFNTEAQEAHGYTLDELIEQAQSTLQEAGRE